ncbi:hypothetical protein FACS189499_08560 [Clostridia bacterium]|nr:hypothetical protein FACS189499_08560 [Clostridia bacterium]
MLIVFILAVLVFAFPVYELYLMKNYFGYHYSKHIGSESVDYLEREFDFTISDGIIIEEAYYSGSDEYAVILRLINLELSSVFTNNLNFRESASVSEYSRLITLSDGFKITAYQIVMPNYERVIYTYNRGGQTYLVIIKDRLLEGKPFYDMF